MHRRASWVAAVRAVPRALAAACNPCHLWLALVRVVCGQGGAPGALLPAPLQHPHVALRILPSGRAAPAAAGAAAPLFLPASSTRQYFASSCYICCLLVARLRALWGSGGRPAAELPFRRSAAATTLWDRPGIEASCRHGAASHAPAAVAGFLLTIQASCVGLVWSHPARCLSAAARPSPAQE